jgi:hypothetical protein
MVNLLGSSGCMRIERKRHDRIQKHEQARVVWIVGSSHQHSHYPLRGSKNEIPTKIRSKSLESQIVRHRIAKRVIINELAIRFVETLRQPNVNIAMSSRGQHVISSATMIHRNLASATRIQDNDKDSGISINSGPMSRGHAHFTAARKLSRYSTTSLNS